MFAHIACQQVHARRCFASFQARQSRTQAVDEPRGGRHLHQQWLAFDKGHLQSGQHRQRQTEQRPGNGARGRRPWCRTERDEIVDEYRGYVARASLDVLLVIVDG